MLFAEVIMAMAGMVIAGAALASLFTAGLLQLLSFAERARDAA